MGPPDGGRPNPTCKITDWKRVSTALEKIDTPPLNSIPDNIRTTDEIDSAIGALTNHIRTVVEKCEREVPASSDRRKFPPDILELIRAKNKALRRASAYPTPEYRSRARALQREVKARVQEFRNECWSDLMEEIRPSHKAFWSVTKALKTEGYTPIPPLKRLDGSTALDDAEVAEVPCRLYRDSMLSHDLTPVSLSEVQLLVRSLKTRKAPGLDGIIRFRPAHSCPQQVLRVVEYISEGFKINKTVAVFFDVAKAFDRVWHAEQESLKAPPSLCCTPHTPTTYRARRPASNSRFSQMTPRFITSRNRTTLPTIRRLQRAIDELGSMVPTLEDRRKS
ncbi:hypothetical protein EVAR_61695_1 [Eumeta japonica]|uniref:Uncharacterized protein n=1 Tax=Eumeta variegata TaxID=151549 RepID=A0A4C1ZJJ2_EUMVA|nr:hypothetical protein EVAR_61695_1 [Eumeta japonica]